MLGSLGSHNRSDNLIYVYLVTVIHLIAPTKNDLKNVGSLLLPNICLFMSHYGMYEAWLGMPAIKCGLPIKVCALVAQLVRAGRS